jgi:Zn-dependent protease
VESPLQPSLVVAIFEFVILLFSLSFHECAHAWTASRLGDQTARLQGRVTLNPIYHIDPIGTLLFPAIAIFGPLIGLRYLSGMLIGWAKPTPVISRNFTKIRRDENLVTLAGPVSNLLLAAVAFIGLVVISLLIPGGRFLVLSALQGGLSMDAPSGLQAFVLLSVLGILINLSLFIFNLLPIPPLDGSHLLRNALPYNALQTYDRIPTWLGWILMIFFGRVVLGFLLSPMLAFVYIAIRLLPGS